MSDEIDLSLVAADETWPEPAGHVDVTSRLASGEVWRIATVGGAAVLTISGAEDTASVRLAEGDVSSLHAALNAAETDLRRTRMGIKW
jgi:hypothetical protein